MVGLSTVLTVAVLAVAVFSLLVVYRIDRPDGRWGARLRSRFVMGVPWGTLVSALVVVSVYLFVQGGIHRWNDPVTIPFRAWSFLYPTGMITATFAHSSLDHLLGNLAGTLVLAPIAEYAWGHFPRDRGSSSFGSLLTNPWVRALVVFPGAVVLGGLLLAVISLGPVIGFSGVVFAFAGFALVRYPIAAVVGVVATGLVRRVYAALQDPIVTATAQPQPPSAPWWAEIAIQGHAVGLLLGVLVGIYVFGRRDERPSAVRVWFGVALFGVERALWAVYWYRGNERYVLFQGVGIVLVGLLAILVALGVTSSDRPLAARLGRLGAKLHPRRPEAPTVQADGAGDPAADVGSDPEGPGADGDGSDERSGMGSPVRRALAGPLVALGAVKRRHAVLVVLLVSFAVLAGPGVGSNAVTAASHDAPGDGMTVGDYSITYAEGVTNEMVSIVDISALNETTQVETSGVIVTSQRRNIWYQAVSKGRLAFRGYARVDVGGPGWRDHVWAIRRGWSASGGGTAYKVWLRDSDGNVRRVFDSPPATASPVVDGRNVSVVAADESFRLRVSLNNTTLGSAPIPDPGNATAAGGLRLENEENAIYAVHNRTRVQVAKKEEYE